MAAKPSSANATTVSKALTEAGMVKSERFKIRIGYGSTPGFRAENDTAVSPETRKRVRTGTVTVSWASGNFVTLPGDVERGAAQLANAAEILTAQGYTVETSTGHSGHTFLHISR